MKRSWLIRVLIPGMLLCLLSGCAGAENARRYREGKSALSQSRYQEAAELFVSLEGYRDSEAYLDRMYAQGLSAYEEGNYAEAEAVFSALAPFGIRESAVYAGLAQGQQCLSDLDMTGAFAALDAISSETEAVTALRDTLMAMCFPNSTLLRPEFLAPELKDGRIQPEISLLSQDPYQEEYLYAMPQNAVDSVFRQYRDYCAARYPDSFSSVEDSYFTFRIQESTCYVCNYYALYGGLVIKLPRY